MNNIVVTSIHRPRTLPLKRDGSVERKITIKYTTSWSAMSFAETSLSLVNPETKQKIENIIQIAFNASFDGSDLRRPFKKNC